METPEGTTGCWSPSLPSFLLGVTAAILGYYWMCMCKKPTIVSSKPLRLLLERYCPVVSEKFYPTIWCFEGRMQTALWIHFVRKPIMSYRNEVIAAEDGGQLSLDWKDNEESSQFPDGATRPIAIILPGLNGNSQKIYILNLAKAAMEVGYRAVVINNRGFGGEQVLTPKTLCVGYTLDMRTVVCHLKSIYPEAPLVAVGSSLGAVILLNYLADYGASSHLQAAVSLSPLWNLFQSDISLSKPLNHWLLHKTIIQGVKKTMRSRKLSGNTMSATPRLPTTTSPVMNIIVKQVQTIDSGKSRPLCSVSAHWTIPSPPAMQFHWLRCRPIPTLLC
ncbi:protein ABHD1 isoform X2 [Xenopus laevis]|uniref:Protein ABHD1 isoform X2 n=1 Tax=Xenopus laevis TaxID=8355 RepID=A0A8J1KQJ7_XENLA|nr:protein ABHD1 isoform X2 [Xenopus laevis]